MPARTALDLITASLKRIGVLSGIETPAAGLAGDGLDRLDSLFESWATESLNIYASLVVDTPLIGSKASYSIGLPAGDIATARPEWINAGTLVMSGNPVWEYPLQQVYDQGWEQAQMKLLPSTQPTHYYYNPTYPLGTISLWPVYTGGGALKLRLYLPQLLSSWPTLTTTVDLPLGYYRALRDNLAMELAPELDRPVDGTLFQIAVDAKAALKRVNTRPRLLAIDAALRCGSPSGAYDWRTDS